MTPARRALAVAFLSVALPTSLISNVIPASRNNDVPPPAPTSQVAAANDSVSATSPTTPAPSTNTENTSAKSTAPEIAAPLPLTLIARGEHDHTGDNDVKAPLPNTWRTLTGALLSNTGLSRLLAPAPAARSAALVAEPALGPNLIPNPSVETAASASMPTGWQKGGYGANTRAFAYPVAGSTGASSKAIRVTVTNYSAGDAKWFFDDVPIEAGAQYQFSDKSMGTVPSEITARFKLSDGSFSYKFLADVPATAAFQTNTLTLTAPANAVSLTIFHLIDANGTLTTDDYSLNKISASPPPPPPSDPSNLVKNGDFETAGTSASVPANWIKGGYGTNTRTFSYPTPGKTGNGAGVTVTGYTAGDAKWAFDPVSVTPGTTYTYSDAYRSSISSKLTAQFKKSDGTIIYSDLRLLPAAASWATVAVDFTVPAGVASVTIFHLIEGNGTLTLDDVAIKGAGASGGTGIFTTGAVTFRFDDGVSSHYSVAAPKLDSAGFKGVFYIISKQTLDTGYSGYMSINNIKNLAARGHEIGAHTRTHLHLPQMTEAEQRDQIQGSRQDIQAWNVGSVLSFAYPYGEYNSTTLDIVEEAGFTTGLSTIDDFAKSTSDPYQIEHQEMNPSVTFAQAKAWVDAAAANKTWLILTFHRIDTSGVAYSTTPAIYNQIVDYVKQKGIPVVTPTQGRASMP